ncbi:signal peptide, CUB and EGF-like domain-containing protein 2 [Liolophura sinensis]|uniref:signal peptide, CUB and EGF-like domain-containing protein 2 n=1 Tax=Liolophura sinensis TaxID=3198878 RepID=UPI003158B505
MRDPSATVILVSNEGFPSRCDIGKQSEVLNSCDIAICYSNPAGQCLNDGKCVRPDECDCPSGTQLPMCEDIDECNTTNGGCTDRCVNSVGTYHCECDAPKDLLADLKSCAFRCFDEPTGTCANGGVCVDNDVCDCPDGTTSPRCEDIDECHSAENICEHTCVNVPASFHCTCLKGYEVLEDLHSCAPVCFHMTPGTCLNSHKCSAPDECSCSEGYELPMCEDKDECLDTKSHACRQLCINELGSYRCDCKIGYVLAADEVSCDDVDECVGEPANGNCTEICENVPGTFNCLCNDGYQLMADQISCEAVCFAEEPGFCPNQGTCVSPGVCECQPGYSGHNCSDTDECASNNGGCEFSCVNEVGSFFCDCFDGFTLIVEDNTCEG